MVAAGAQRVSARGKHANRKRLHISASATAEYSVWPDPAPELADSIVEEDVQEALPDRLQRYAKVSLSAGVLVVLDQGTKWAMQALGVQFPHTLTGMLIIVAASVSAKAAGGAAADTVDKCIELFGPLRDWVARWMPVFFVPSLISLPLATASMSGGEIARIAQVIIVGWSMSLLLATLTLKAIRSVVHSSVTQQEVRTPCTARATAPLASAVLRLRLHVHTSRHAAVQCTLHSPPNAMLSRKLALL